LTEKLHPRAIKGIIFFNQKKFFEAHEELEIAWRDEPGQIRDLYRGILQVGVAYYHISRKNFSGAKKLLIRSEKWLKPFPDKVLGINLKKLKSDSTIILNKLENGFFDNLTKIDNELFSEIEFKSNQDQK
jgi:predicted metal-dependent hydrolase